MSREVRAPLAVEALPPEEQPVAQMAALVLDDRSKKIGEQHRLLNSRMRAIALFVFIVGIGGGWYLKHNADSQSHKLAVVTQQLAMAQARTDANCRQVNRGVVDNINSYLDQVVENARRNVNLTPPARQRAIDNANEHRSQRLDCGTTIPVAAPAAPQQARPGGQRYSYRPFEGPHDVSDAVRILVCLTGVALLGVIGRVMREGVRRHNMDRWQLARFLGLATLVMSLSLGSAERFGIGPNWHLPVNLAGLLVCWFGVLGERRLQRRGRT